MGTSRVALLRGINVGGKNKLPMRDLIAFFEEAGCQNVRTLIQSGNVVFTASTRVCGGLASAIAAKISERFGYTTPLILRTADQLRDVIANNPFLTPGVNEDSLHVMFLADRPAPAKVAALDPNRSSPDRFAVRGQEVFLHLPNGGGNTKLSNAWFDSKLGTTSTVRNWRTVNRLLVMMDE
jgi:uncharacterized protein (DUF1697 family)